MTDILTNSGKLVKYSQPAASTININDIAHSLSMQCRFNGHCYNFYSIAQHCVHCAEQIKNGPNYTLQMIALLHDAHEAYVGDINTNFKKLLNGNGHQCITDLDTIIHRKFIGRPLNESQLDLIDTVDKRMLVTEMDQLMPATEIIFFDGRFRPFDITITPWSQPEAKVRFMAKFKELEVLL